MATAIILIQLALVLALIFIGARVGGIGLGIYGMVGVFILVFVFGLKPGNLPIDVMLIIVSVITAASTLQAAGGLDYLVGVAARFLRKHPEKITYYGSAYHMALLPRSRNRTHQLFAASYHLRDSHQL